MSIKKNNKEYSNIESYELKLKSRIKNKFLEFLINTFNLIEVDPIYITKSKYLPNFKRLINFDNAIDGNIYSINEFIDFSILSYFSILSNSIGSGIITYYCKFSRDFAKFSKYNFNFLLLYKLVQEEANENNIGENVLKIFKGFNEIIKPYSNFKNLDLLPKLKITNVDNILKKYPLLKFNDALNQEIFSQKFILVFGLNGKNRKNINLIDYKSEIYVNNYGKLFFYDEKIEKILEFGIVNICPSQDNIIDYVKRKHIDQEVFSNILKNFPKNENLLTIDINFSKIFFYLINESDFIEKKL